MSTGQNLQLTELLETAAEIARSENRPTADVLRDAIERYRQSKGLRALATRAAARNASAGRKPSDINRAIAEDRRNHPSRSR